MQFDVSLKEQAEAMLISSAHLSGLEFGDKKLHEHHIARATRFFQHCGASGEQMSELKEAAARSMESLNTKEMSADARAMVFAFARKLQEQNTPPADVMSWLTKETGQKDPK
jgi:hypothetical protein